MTPDITGQLQKMGREHDFSGETRASNQILAAHLEYLYEQHGAILETLKSVQSDLQMMLALAQSLTTETVTPPRARLNGYRPDAF